VANWQLAMKQNLDCNNVDDVDKAAVEIGLSWPRNKNLDCNNVDDVDKAAAEIGLRGPH
jgi:hypothetical protein